MMPSRQRRSSGRPPAVAAAWTIVVALACLGQCLAYAPAYQMQSSRSRAVMPIRCSNVHQTSTPNNYLKATTFGRAVRSKLFATGEDNTEEEEEEEEEEEDSSEDTSTDAVVESSSSEEDEEDKKKGLLARIKAAFKTNEDDGLTFKQRLAKMGLSALLSYGFVSNMSYSVTVSLAWFGFSKKTGLSPLAPGQWKPFLAVYAGFYIFNNVIRPVRLAVSVGVTPYFDRAVAAVQRKTKLNKSAAIGVVVFLANFCGTLTAMSFGILLASIAAGVPILPPKA